MKISIAMATYNGAAFLPAQLASFVAQTRRPDELVVTDDGSVDETPDILRAFARTAPFPVRFEVNPKTLGVGQNFSRAMALCTGDLVYLSDQDDVWLDDKIACIATLAEAEPTRSCFMNDALLADGDLKPNGEAKLAKLRAAGLPDTDFVMGCCAAARRNLLDVVLPVPVTIGAHDSWLVQTADFLGQTLRIDAPLQYYRRHGANVSDFFVNRIEKPSLLQDLWGWGGRRLRGLRSSANLMRELGFLTALAERLTERRDAFLDLVGEVEAQRLEATLRRRIEVLGQRCRAREARLRTRPGAILALWRQGGYRVSGGAAGMLKDSLGKRART